MTFFQKNKVLIIGLIVSMLSAIVPFVTPGVDQEVKIVVVVAAVAAAGLAKYANDKRGQMNSIASSVIPLALEALHVISQGGKTNWQLLLLQMAITGLMAWQGAQSPDAKLRGYEHTPTIEGAKEEAKDITKNL